MNSYIATSWWSCNPKRKPERPKEKYKTTEAKKIVQVAEIPVHEAVNSYSNSDEWSHAIALQLRSLIKNDTFILTNSPRDQDVINIRTVLRNKYNQNAVLIVIKEG